jgi:hypothetical protein
VTMPSRGIGAVMDSKMPKAKTITRKDDPNKVKVFKAGGKSRVNEAGNYTKPGLRKAQFLNGSKQVVKVVIRGNGAPARHKCWLSSTKNLEEVIVINIEDFRLKTIPFIPVKHRQDCLVMQDGPCTCGLEEVLEDEAREEYESASEES